MRRLLTRRWWRGCTRCLSPHLLCRAKRQRNERCCRAREELSDRVHPAFAKPNALTPGASGTPCLGNSKYPTQANGRLEWGTVQQREWVMNWLIKILTRLGLLKDDLDYHLIRASMVIIFLFFGYQKWFDYEAQALVPYISHGPLIFWMYPVFGIRGATYFLGASEWLFGALLFAGFWNKKWGILGALGACASMIATSTSIPFMPDGWAASAGGFPAMTERVAFLMKDIVIFAASFYLLKQDVARVSLPMGVPSEYQKAA